jgi:hypothetical protein
MTLKGMVCEEDINWIALAEDRVSWRDVEKTVLKPLGYFKWNLWIN